MCEDPATKSNDVVIFRTFEEIRKFPVKQRHNVQELLRIHDEGHIIYAQIRYWMPALIRGSTNWLVLGKYFNQSQPMVSN